MKMILKSDTMYSMIYITARDLKEARRISQALLDKKLIACANIIPKIESGFWWKGRIEKCNESAIICKTKNKLVKEVIAEVKKNHSYDVPDIIEIPIKSGNRDFLRWIDGVTN